MLAYTDEVILDGEWKLAYCSQKQIESFSSLPCRWEDIVSCGLPVIPALVPGNVELDLCKAGLLEDPLVADHIYQSIALEDQHYWYGCHFEFTKDPSECYLRLEGLDTFGDIYLNGCLVGNTDNMLISHTLFLPNLQKGDNELLIHISPTILKAREKEHTLLSRALAYSYDSLYVRKAPYMFGWDIMPRLVSAGLWKSVHIVRRKPVGFTQCYLYTTDIHLEIQKASMTLFYELELGDRTYGNLQVRISMNDGNHIQTYEQAVWGKAGKLCFTLDKARMWWPRGYGEPFLYQVTVELLERGECLDSNVFETGVRQIKLNYRSRTEQENGRFEFEVNGRPFFAIGTNWVPLHAFPSQNASRVAEALELAENVGCNMLRCWGGNVYENDEFYSICDKKGILVWQDFSMACASYPQDADFLRQIEKEIRQVVRERRHHPCICLWAGDNECDASFFLDIHPHDNSITRELLPYILKQEDYTRPYLPSSPYMDESVCKMGIDASVEQHLWGERFFFDIPYYTSNSACFASEIGFHACPSPQSVKEFIEPAHLWPGWEDEQWLLHASSPETTASGPFTYRIPLMKTQVYNLCGQVPDTLEKFALYSQISQAEALKLFIETFRTDMGNKTGIIWWNLLDGCPQFSDAVVDFYFRKKLAYFYLQAVQQPILLAVQKQESDCWLYGVNDTDCSQTIRYVLCDAETDYVWMNGTVNLPARAATRICKVDVPNVPMLMIRWTDLNEKKYQNHAYLGDYPMNIERYIAAAQRNGILKLDGFEQDVLM